MRRLARQQAATRRTAELRAVVAAEVSRARSEAPVPDGLRLDATGGSYELAMEYESPAQRWWSADDLDRRGAGFRA